MTIIRSSRPANPRGGALILVLVSVAVAFVIGMTFLASSTTTTGIARTMDHHAQARQIAESGLHMAVRYVQQTPDWRDARPNGTWINDLSLFGGAVSVSGEFAANPSMSIDDLSFEQQIGQLATPALGPPMSGTIGGWEVERTALLPTGPTVPAIGVEASADATDGGNRAFISFGAAVTGSGVFRQTLPETLEPDTTYEAAVDIATSGFPPLDTSLGIRVLAGGVVVASSEHAATLALPALPEELPTLPSELPSDPELDTVLEILGLGGGVSRFTLRFSTGNAPQAGALVIELFAESIGVLSEVTFDNVHVTVQTTQPLVLTAVGRHDQASHVVRASVIPVFEDDGTKTARIVQWSEP